MTAEQEAKTEDAQEEVREQEEIENEPEMEESKYEPCILRLKKTTALRQLKGPGPVEAGYEVNIIHNDEVQPVVKRDGDTVVSLPADARYKIRVVNANCHAVEMNLCIDGLDAGTYILSDYTCCDIERTLKHIGHLCLTRHVDGSPGRIINITCTFSAPTDAPIREFTIHKGWGNILQKSVKLFPTHSIQDLLKKAKARWNTEGTDFLLFCFGDDWKARALEEHSIPHDVTIANLPTDLYYLEHRKITFTFSHNDGRLVKSVGFRRDLTLQSCVQTLSKQWRLDASNVVLCTSRGAFHCNSIAADEHILSLFTMDDLLKSRGALHALVCEDTPEGYSRVTVRIEQPPTTYQLLLKLNQYTVDDLCQFVCQERGLDKDYLHVRCPAQSGDAPSGKCLADLGVVADSTVVIVYDEPKVAEIDPAGDIANAVHSKCSSPDDVFSEEAYRVVDLKSNCPQKFIPVLGFDTASKMAVKLQLTLLER